MSSETPNPVSPIGSEPSARDPQQVAQAQLLLEQCWEIISDILLSRIGDIFNEAISAAARSGEESQIRCARTLSIQGRALAHAYWGALRSEFDGAVAAFLGKRAASPVRKAGLSLMELGQSDLTNQVDQEAARLRGLVEAPLTVLTMRLQTLAGGRELSDGESPVRPGIFLQAVAASLATPLPAPGDLAALLHRFPAALAPALAAAYEGIDRFLEGKGIVPTVPVRAAAAPRSSGPAAIRAAPAARHKAEPGGEPDEQGLVEYARLQALVGINATALVDAALGAARNTGTAPEATIASPGAALLSAMLAGQKQDAERIAAPERTREPSKAPGPVPDPAPGQVPGHVAPETREYSKRLIAVAAHRVHKLTIQLVARLFARIERDKLVPGPLRELIVALRFPAMEVALADPALLVRSDHPARQLINAIGTSAIGWSAESPNGRRYLQQVRAAVQLVLHSPGGAASAFEQARAQFANFLAANPPIPEEAFAKAQEALREAEDREVRAADVAAFLHEVLDGAHLDAYMRIFLFQVWARVLVEAAERESADPGLVRKLLGAVPDLVWSVQPLTSAADRKRLADTIPAVLACVRQGVGLIHWPDEDLKAFLEQLMQAHSLSLKAVPKSPEAQAHGMGNFSVSTARIRFDGFRIEALSPAPRDKPLHVLEEAVRHVLRARGCGVSHQWARSADVPSFSGLDAKQAEQEIARWREKSWFQLRVGRAMTRVRLEWFTPSQTLALFSSRRGDALYSLSRAGLVTYLRSSWIKPAEANPLLARAFQTVLSDLERASEATAASANVST